MRNARSKSGVLVAALLLAVFVYVAGCTLPLKTNKKKVSQTEPEKPVSYNELYNEVSPSVVTVYSNFGPEMLYDESVQASSGSGFVFREDGYIITNYHVVTDDDLNPVSSVEVALKDGKTLVAKIKGTDPLNDVAIIKVEESGLPPVKMGTVKDVKVGDQVFVIGSPGAGGDVMRTTLTAGIVSAKDRTFEGIVRLHPNLIQIDAAINPGNSGGPVFDAKGRVIGIATLRDPETQNIGFAVPIDVAKRSADEIVKSGSLKRGWIGVDTFSLDRVLARALQFKIDEGVLVVRIAPGGPADKGGMQRLDVIQEVDGKKIKTNTQLEDILFKKKIGGSVELKIDRNGESKTLTLTIEEVPSGKL